MTKKPVVAEIKSVRRLSGISYEATMAFDLPESETSSVIGEVEDKPCEVKTKNRISAEDLNKRYVGLKVTL